MSPTLDRQSQYLIIWWYLAYNRPAHDLCNSLMVSNTCLISCFIGKRPSIYYVRKGLGGLVLKIASFADVHYYIFADLTPKSGWVDGSEKVQNYAHNLLFYHIYHWHFLDFEPDIWRSILPKGSQGLVKWLNKINYSLLNLIYT